MAENDEEVSKDSGEELDEEISWDDAAADLDKQREMLLDNDAADDDATQVSDEAGVSAEGEADKVEDNESTEAGEIPKNFDRILDIPLVVTVELGGAKMLINDLLQLGQGSVIELAKLIGEPLDVKINDKLIAKGEAVVVNEKFGIKLTEIVSAIDRIESLS